MKTPKFSYVDVKYYRISEVQDIVYQALRKLGWSRGRATRFIDKYHIYGLGDDKPGVHGGTTVVTIKTEDGRELTGVSNCSPDDVFVERLGRAAAVKNAFEVLECASGE